MNILQYRHQSDVNDILLGICFVYFQQISDMVDFEQGNTDREMSINTLFELA